MAIVDPYYPKVFLLMNMDQLPYPVDQSNAKTFIQTHGTGSFNPIQISNTTTKIMSSGASNRFAKLRFPSGSRILAGDFTMEIYAKSTGNFTGTKTLFDTPTTNNLTVRQTTSRVDVWVGGINTSAYFPTSTGNWRLEIVRTGGVIRSFFEGFQRGSDATITDPIELEGSLLFNNQALTEPWLSPGGIFALRFTDDAARHTADFTSSIPNPPYALRYCDIVGTIKDHSGANVPAGWRVYAIRRDTGEIAGTALTVAGGTYTLPCNTDQEVSIVCANPEVTLYNDQVVRLLPA